MPNILVKVPKGAFPGGARQQLLRHITDAAATAEQIPADPRMRVTTWVAMEEVEPGMLVCGGEDLTAQLVPCIAVVYVPEGVLDAAATALYVQLVHDAFKQALPVAEKRRLASSVVLQTVAEGTWGGSGSIVTLSDLAAAAGYAHLQHLVKV